MRNFPIDDDLKHLKIRREKAEESWEEFQEVQLKIEITNKTAIATEKAYRSEFEDMYYLAISGYEKILENRNKSNGEYSGEESNAENISHHSMGGSNGGSCTSNQASIVKLAALNVPQFSGDYNEWSTFHDIFVALIHSNDAFTDVQQFFYLKSALIGDARKIIQCLETSSKNYPIAWKCLNERYNN